MANVIKVKKPQITITPGRNSGVIRIDAEAASLLQELAYHARMSVAEMASNLIKYAANNTVIETED